MERNQFTFYKSFLDSARKIKKPTDREKFLMAIIEFALEGKLPDKLPESCDVAFSIALPVLKSSWKKAENASKGGASERKQTEANRSKPKQTEANRKQVKEQVKGEEQVKEQVKEQLEQTGASIPYSDLAALWNAYPVNRCGNMMDLIGTARSLCLTKTDIDTAISNLEVWKACMDWTRDGGQYIPGLCKWLESGAYRATPDVSQMTSNPFLAMMMGGKNGQN